MKKKAEKALAPMRAIVDAAVPATTPALIEYFRALEEIKEPFFEAWDKFPIPVEIFGPDGTIVYANHAIMEVNNITDLSLLIGKYNLLKDPVCMDQLGYRKEIEDAFKGLNVIIKDFPAPVNDLVARGLTKEKPYEAAMMDMYLYPVKRKGKLVFVVCVYYITKQYLGRPDVAKVKEYIDTHWKEDFDKVKLAKAVNMSASQLYRVFTEHAGMSPGDYYNRVKVQRIKEKLEDPNLSIKEAFAQCGESSQGWIAKKTFKEIIEVSPSEYRKKFFAEDMKVKTR